MAKIKVSEDFLWALIYQTDRAKLEFILNNLITIVDLFSQLGIEVSPSVKKEKSEAEELEEVVDRFSYVEGVPIRKEELKKIMNEWVKEGIIR